VPVAYFRDGNKIVANELPKTVLFLNPYDLNIAQKDNLSSELIKDKLAPALLISNFIKNCMYSPVNSQGQITKMPDVLSTTQLKYVQVSDNLNNKVAATTIVEKTNDLAKQQTVAKSETGTLPKESFVGDISGKFTGIINPKSLSHLDNIKSQSNDPAYLL
jgi:hypothetical protein